MDWVLYVALTLLDAILLWWIFTLRRELREIRRDMDSHQPRGTLSEEDLQSLQRSLSTLVQTLQEYTEDSLGEMRQQVSRMQELARGILQEGSESGSKAPRPARGIRIQPDANAIEHREKERIIALHRQGKSVQEISRQLQVTAGEVDLVIRLSS